MIYTKLSSYLAAIAKAHIVCPRCEAPLNKSCTTLAGKNTKTHTSRWEPLLVAYNTGYDDAQKDFMVQKNGVVSGE